MYRHEIDEEAKTLKLWVRRKRGHQKLVCSGCGRELEKAHDVNEREVRDLPCMEFRTTVVVEVYRVCCPDCGIKVEKVAQLPSKAPFRKRFEDAVGQACKSAAARQVSLRFGVAASTVRAIDLRYLERWAADRKKPVLAQMGVDEIHLGKKEKFITVVSNLDSAEPVWFDRERKKETLDGFFQGELTGRQRMRITAACVDMWEPYRLSVEQWARNCRIVYDKFIWERLRTRLGSGNGLDLPYGFTIALISGYWVRNVKYARGPNIRGTLRIIPYALVQFVLSTVAGDVRRDTHASTRRRLVRTLTEYLSPDDHRVLRTSNRSVPKPRILADC